ncbi:hypothetical protein [Corynebacterium cystitidis]|uniref:hypothetical protein n=1 Tax=Corynebacterium cystitidis TaxID=35757 RepID=UPI00211DD60B|nr:hypothetical protein [Corynebacterium cystitidis]
MSEKGSEEALGLFAWAGAPLSSWDSGLDLVDVLAASGPSGFAALLTGDCSAHGEVPFS